MSTHVSHLILRTHKKHTHAQLELVGANVLDGEFDGVHVDEVARLGGSVGQAEVVLLVVVMVGMLLLLLLVLLVLVMR